MRKELQRAIDTIHVRFGGQALVPGGRLAAAQPWPTGIAPVDRLSGIGGLPRGRISALQGPPGSGKLSLGLSLLARGTREFARTVVIDPQRGFDPGTLAGLGADLESLVLVRPPTSAAAGEAATALARAGTGFLLLLDSPPEPALAPLESAAARSGCAVVAVAGEPMPAALAYASSLTLRLRHSHWLVERGLVIGLAAHLTCLKNKLAPPGASAEVEIRYGLGLETTGETLREIEPADLEILELPAWRSAAG